MGLLDTFTPTTPLVTPPISTSAKGVNDIPAPRSDATINAPPIDQHKSVMAFVKEAPTAKYTFDSRRNVDSPDAELCRITPGGGRSCIKLAMHSAALFKSMQSIGFYCSLPAEPHRTDLICDRLPGTA